MKPTIYSLITSTILILFTHSVSISQTYDTVINPSNYNQELLDMAIFRATNDIRLSYNLERFQKDPILDRMANLHAQQMKKYNFFDHGNPYNRQFNTLLKRINAVASESEDYLMLAENIAQYDLLATNTTFCYDTDRGYTRYYNCRTGLTINYYTYRNLAKAVVADWMKSPGHRKNILNGQYNVMGVSVVLISNKTAAPHLPFTKIVQNFGKII
jgi:uncharacterized protein YkwD